MTMAKKILGDNPFAEAAASEPAATGDESLKSAEADVPTSSASAAESADAGMDASDETARDNDGRSNDGRDEAPSAVAETADPVPLPTPPLAEPLDVAVSTAEDSGQRVPDAATPEAIPGFGDADDGAADVVLGGEAAVPPGDYGPPIVSVLPSASERASEFRELERRVNAHATPVFPIERRRRLPMEFLWKRFRRYAMRNRSAAVDDFGRDPVYAANAEPFLDFLCRHYFRVDVEGVDNVPDTGRVLMVANHSGMLPYDGAMIMHVMHKEHPIRRDVRPLLDDYVFHAPYVGTFINRLGAVRACQSNAERLLERDQAIVVFPEGLKGVSKLYRQRYRLQRFGRGGYIKLALRTRSPIVPVAVVGAEEAHPILAKTTWLARPMGLPYLPLTPTFPLLGPLGLLPLPVKWHIRFGSPIDLPGEYSPEVARDRLLVNRLSDSVRSRIQEMVDSVRSHRKTVLFR